MIVFNYQDVRILIFMLLYCSLFILEANAQINTPKEDTTISQPITGRVINEKGAPLAYTTIFILKHHTGAISNENGYYTLEVQQLQASDSIRFQYLGYEPKVVSVSQLHENATITLVEKINTLAELMVFGNPPKPETIIKNVLKNRHKNYKVITSQFDVFIRNRSNEYVNKFALNLKKSSIQAISPSLMQEIEQKTPKHITSYTDFLGKAFQYKSDERSIFKLNPTMVVALKEQEINDATQFEKLVKDAGANVKDEEYWKVKTGILSTKVELSPDSSLSDQDSNIKKMKYLQLTMKDFFLSPYFENDKNWEFLHHPNRYYYSLIGGSSIKNEPVYIIDFEPTKRGLYTGRVFISTETFALVRADFHYAPQKTGTDIHLFGVGFTQKDYGVSLIFEKRKGSYFLTYYAEKSSTNYSVDRSISFLKKRERFLFDKKLEEVKFALDVNMTLETSKEILIVNRKEIPLEKVESTQQAQQMEITYVNQFDDALWKGYPIIEPTKQMKNYTKRAK